MQPKQQAASSPLRGNYLVRNIFVNSYLRCVDRILEVTIRKQSTQVLDPRVILFSNIAHLGDVLIATSVLPVIKRVFPDAKIGFLVGSWASQLLDNHPMVDRVHIVDHWKLNRSNHSFPEKMLQYLRTRSRALREIRQERYDIAIDLYFFFPNSILLLWQSGIPVRIGYSSAGFGSLLTHALEWRDQKGHVLDYHRELLRLLPIDEDALDIMHPMVARVTDNSFNTILEDFSISDNSYIVVHIGSGASFREWPLENWRALAKLLAVSGIRMIFTGLGRSEFDKIDWIINGIDGCTNTCGNLNWEQFVEFVAKAKVVIGVESMAGHLAAAVGTPYIVMKTGITSDIWRPYGDAGVVLTHTVPCAPCYLKNGCESMDCIRMVRIDDVCDLVTKLLQAHG